MAVKKSVGIYALAAALARASFTAEIFQTSLTVLLFLAVYHHINAYNRVAYK